VKRKQKLTTTDGFDFLALPSAKNGKFRCVPSVDNFKAFRQKVKHIVNNSNIGATEAEKLAPVVRGWRNYHSYCKMDGRRFSAPTKTERLRCSMKPNKTNIVPKD